VVHECENGLEALDWIKNDEVDNFKKIIGKTPSEYRKSKEVIA
jgi:hypothetical protein